MTKETFSVGTFASSRSGEIGSFLFHFMVVMTGLSHSNQHLITWLFTGCYNVIFSKLRLAIRGE